MTSPYVTFPSAPPRHRSWWRIALSVVVVIAGVLGAGIAGIIATIVWTGCFIGCSDPDHFGGALLGLLAAVSLASGPAAVSGLYRSAAWMRAAVWTFGAGCAIAAIGLANA